MPAFNPQEFTEKQVVNIRKLVRNEKALVAVSGGVDSTTSAVLTHRAIGRNLLCVILDNAFMREGEPQRVANLVSKPPIELPVKILDAQERFLNAFKGLGDAEEKREIFRETFYRVLGETAQKERCNILVQGTIKADIDETVGGVKTQHNVLEQMGINTTERFGFRVVEPLVSLYKHQVRMVARHLRIPSEISERQPFPGPGLSVRVIGEISASKLDSEKRATAIVEENFTIHKPSQYFAAILDSKMVSYARATHIRESAARLFNVPLGDVSLKVFKAKATGVKGGRRLYGEIAALRIQTAKGDLYNPPISRLISLQAKIVTENPSLTRIFYTIKESPQERPYVVALRAVETTDFLSAKVTALPWATLNKTADETLEACRNVSAVYYDVTPKPPATIEME